MTKPKAYKDLVIPRRLAILERIKAGPLTASELFEVFAAGYANFDNFRADLTAMAKMGWAHSRRPQPRKAGVWYPGPNPELYVPPAKRDDLHDELFQRLCFGKAPKLPAIKGRVYKERAVESTGRKALDVPYGASPLGWVV